MELATILFNLLATGASLWLGFYIVTRSPQSQISWLAAVALWALSLLFLYKALVVDTPVQTALFWLRPIAVFGMPLWFHMTHLLAPPAQGRLAALQYSVLVPLCYVATGLLVAGGAFPSPLVSDLQTGPAYLFLLLFVFIAGTLSAVNLWRGYRRTLDPLLQNIFVWLLAPTAVAYVGGVALGLSIWLQERVDSFPAFLIFLFNIICGTSVLLVGYAVAKYNAFVEGRAIAQDTKYSLLGIGAIGVLYGLVVLLLYQYGQITFLALVSIFLCAIVSHSLYEGSRAALDRLFYHGQLQQLRANLRTLAREAGTTDTLSDRLQAILTSLCRNLNSASGFIALRSGDVFVVEATEDSEPIGEVFLLSDLTTTEIVELPPSNPPRAVHAVLLVPLCAHGQQVGALVLDAKSKAQAYTETDLELLETLQQQMASVIHATWQQEQNAQIINDMISSFRTRERDLQQQIQQLLSVRQPETPTAPEDADEQAIFASLERCFQRIHDFAFLGEQPLARWAIVERALHSQRPENGDQSAVTNLDRGRVLHEILLHAISKLRPEGEEPASHVVPARQWHLFLVLQDGYVRNELTRDVMSRLAVSEATFHRIRRRAVRSIAQALLEMEQKAQLDINPGAGKVDSM